MLSNGAKKLLNIACHQGFFTNGKSFAEQYKQKEQCRPIKTDGFVQPLSIIAHGQLRQSQVERPVSFHGEGHDPIVSAPHIALPPFILSVCHPERAFQINFISPTTSTDVFIAANLESRVVEYLTKVVACLLT